MARFALSLHCENKATFNGGISQVLQPDLNDDLRHLPFNRHVISSELRVAVPMFLD